MHCQMKLEQNLFGKCLFTIAAVKHLLWVRLEVLIIAGFLIEPFSTLYTLVAVLVSVGPFMYFQAYR